jgi:hypothetical protein
MSVLVSFHFSRTSTTTLNRAAKLRVSHPRRFRSESVSPRVPSQVELDLHCLMHLMDGDDLLQITKILKRKNEIFKLGGYIKH